MWWIKSGWSGRISIDVIQVSSLKGLGIVMSVHSRTPLAGTLNSGMSTITSGLICHPFSGQTTGAGASCAAPSGAPLSTHVVIASISAADNVRSFLKCPIPGSANQGGILREATAFLIALAHGRVDL